MACHPKSPTVVEKTREEVEALFGGSLKKTEKSSQIWDAKAPGPMTWQPAPSTKTKSQDRQSQQRRYAYLDGLRGFAALLVYMLHYQGLAHEFLVDALLQNAFGYDGHYHFAAFPGVRLFFSGGHHGVTVFFIISGYVLSNSALRSVQTKNTDKLVDTVGSALFRRWIRLYIPVFGTTFLWMTSWHLLGVQSVHGREKTFAEELVKWYHQMKNMSFIFNDTLFNTYNFHLWSIPLEFRGSIIVYTAVLALRRASAGKRLCCEAMLVWYFLYVVDGWYCALFMMGMLLCDIDLLAERDELPRIFGYLKPLESWIYPVLLIIGIYLGGVPSVNENMEYLRGSPGWYYLSFLKPQAMWDFRWFYRFWAATLTMIAVPRLPKIKAFFETRFCQYLGRVSYGFYLIHGPILWSLGSHLYAASGRVRDHHVQTSAWWINRFPLPGWGPVGLEFNTLAPHLILFPFTLWAADVVTQLFDEPSVRISQWLLKLVTDPEETPRKTQPEHLV